MHIALVNFSFSSHLEDFYKLLQEPTVVKLKINFVQNQFDKQFQSIGDFYILGPMKYFYDSAEIKIFADSNSIVTKNCLTKQVVYNDLDQRQLSIFDIISGNKRYIEFSDELNDFNRYNYFIKSMGFEGYFLFEPNSRSLKLIYLELGSSQSVSIKVSEIEVLDAYEPAIDLEDYEVIDLRG